MTLDGSDDRPCGYVREARNMVGSPRSWSVSLLDTTFTWESAQEQARAIAVERGCRQFVYAIGSLQDDYTYLVADSYIVRYIDNHRRWMDPDPGWYPMAIGQMLTHLLSGPRVISLID